MATETRGGLAGKARRIHARRRAAKHHSDQLILDYFQSRSDGRRPGDSPGHGRRPIPVRGRGEFLPSAVGFEQGESVAAVEASGESWNTSTAARRPWERRIVWPPEAVERERADVAERSTGDTDRVIQFNPNAQRGQTAPRDEKPARPKLRFPQEWPGPRQLRRRRSQPFTIGGFAYGCVLGSAAAAMILLVVEIAF